MFANPIYNAFLTMTISISVIIFILLALKKYSLKVRTLNNDLDMKIIAKLNLPPKSFLYIIQAGNKKILLGVAEKSITKLAELDDDMQIINQEEGVEQVFDNINNLIPDMKKYKANLSFSSFVKSVFSKN